MNMWSNFRTSFLYTSLRTSENYQVVETRIAQRLRIDFSNRDPNVQVFPFSFTKGPIMSLKRCIFLF